LTPADAIRLWLVARSKSDPWPAADRLALAAVQFEPTVKPNSFDTIEEHVGSVYRYALRLARRTDLAEDLTQETMLRGWRNRRKLRDPRAARVWLLRIATDLWNDELRRAKFRTQTLAADPPCPRPVPHVASDERENVRMALAAMDELPPRQRQVLYLATCEGLAHAEVATILEITEASVKSNLSLARKEMRRRLKDLYEEVCGRAARSEA
jgi:RNA polymerase sigma-70 factor (ECF subfamily)